MKRIKLFAGIELSPAVRKACAAISDRLRGSGLNARFEAPEKLHITLAFLGWVEPEAIGSIGEALEQATHEGAPFDLTLDKLGAFPHERRPRVVWLGARKNNAAFQSLARTVRAEFEELGVSFEKDALAHITLARVKGGDAHLPQLDVKPMNLQVNALTLFESIPYSRTTRYEVRARSALNDLLGRRDP